MGGHNISDPFRPEELAAALRCLRENPWVWIPSSQSLYSMPDQLSNLGFAVSSLPACTKSKF